MNRIENLLKKEKNRLDQLEVPDDLECRLYNALHKKSSLVQHKRKKHKSLLRIASIILCIFLLSYNINTLAFYSKKLIGYDNLMSGPLNKLNEEERGQIIKKKYTFENGVVVLLNGAMLDNNQLILFYTVSYSEEKVEDINLFPNRIEGLLSNNIMTGSIGEIDEKNNSINYIGYFKPPYLFEKTLTWKFTLIDNKKAKEGSIEFKLDRNKAMAATLKNNINKSISVDSHKINFDSIEASPTVTIVKGSIDSIFDLAKEQISGEMFRVDKLDLSLIVNGTSYEWTGADMSTNMDGMKFEYSFPPLPDTLKSLNLELKSFKANERVEKNINLRKDMTDTIVNLINKKIVINRVYEKDNETLVTFTSTDDILLSPVNLIVDGKDVSLKNTTTNTREKLVDGTISHTRTMHFPAKGIDLKLYISKIYYTKNYNKKINIPLH